MYDWEVKDDGLRTWVRLRQAYEALDRLLETNLGRRGATLAQVDVLMILSASKEALTPGEIAKYTFRQQHSASAQLSRMAEAGLVSKERQVYDERVVKINIEPAGQELLKASIPVGPGEASTLLKSCLSGDEMRELDKLLKKVRDCALQQSRMQAEPLPPTIDVSVW